MSNTFNNNENKMKSSLQSEDYKSSPVPVTQVPQVGLLSFVTENYTNSKANISKFRLEYISKATNNLDKELETLNKSIFEAKKIIESLRNSKNDYKNKFDSCGKELVKAQELQISACADLARFICEKDKSRDLETVVSTLDFAPSLIPFLAKVEQAKRTKSERKMNHFSTITDSSLPFEVTQMTSEISEVITDSTIDMIDQMRAKFVEAKASADKAKKSLAMERDNMVAKAKALKKANDRLTILEGKRNALSGQIQSVFNSLVETSRIAQANSTKFSETYDDSDFGNYSVVSIDSEPDVLQPLNEDGFDEPNKNEYE